MTTSRNRSKIAKPEGDEKISLGTLGYFRARNRGRVHKLVLDEFAKSGLTRKTLALRLGQDPARITRLLNGVGNLTLDTISDLLFAISAAEPEYGVGYPLDQPTVPKTPIADAIAKPSNQSQLPSDARSSLLGRRNSEKPRDGHDGLMKLAFESPYARS